MLYNYLIISYPLVLCSVWGYKNSALLHAKKLSQLAERKLAVTVYT